VGVVFPDRRRASLVITALAPTIVLEGRRLELVTPVAIGVLMDRARVDHALVW
jgi:hypothetical protein